MKAQSSIGDHRLQSSHGGNQVTVGQYNERLVISLLRRHGWLTKAELARLTGLSAQTMTVIVKRLMENDLLVQGAPKRVVIALIVRGVLPAIYDALLARGAPQARRCSYPCSGSPSCHL